MGDVSEAGILKALKASRGLTFSHLCKRLPAKHAQKIDVRRILKKLLKDGKIFKRQDKKYAFNPYNQNKDTFVGQIHIHEKGFGFVTIEGQSEDVFVAPRNLKNAQHMDKVKISVVDNPKNKKKEGLVTEVITDKDKVWLGVVLDFNEHNFFFCPWGQRVSYEIDPHLEPDVSLKEDDIVLARLEKNKKGVTKAVLISRLGHIDDPGIDSPLVMHEFELQKTFTPQAIKASRAQPTTDPCTRIRQDLTHLPFVTIDGSDAKDFDDAVYMDDKNHLWVAIADVSHFVQTESQLDIEACERGNSYYFPDCVLPMLPEHLSNGACSLRPFEEKFAMVVEIAFDAQNNAKLIQITPAKITSKARLTYASAQEMLDGKKPFEPLCEDSLKKLHTHTKVWRQKRMEDGGIDFDMPEVRYVDQALEPTRTDRLDTHMLIEECMLMANKMTSRFVSEKKFPNVFRVHEEPNEQKGIDAVDNLHKMLKIEAKWEPPKNGFDIRHILEDLKTHPLYTQIQYLFLRTMAQARYDTEQLGHFGLGFEYYSHFTSPIRRYADLVFHRIVKHILLDQEARQSYFPKTYQTLNNVCVHISKQDRTSLMVEREIKKIKGIRYMNTHINQVFDGIVIGLLQKGIFVETQPFGIEGFISFDRLRIRGLRFSQADNDFRNQKTSLSFGSQIQIKVIKADLFKRQLDFELI